MMGDINAQFHLGIVLENDLEWAIYWYKRAAEQGHYEAQLNLGIKYACVLKDSQQAIYWLQNVAEKGNIEIKYVVANFYYSGLGCINKDYQKAVYWYQKTADQGYERALFRLGYMYAKGIGVPKNFCKAEECYQKAAEQGNPRFQFILGRIYAKGFGIPRNHRKATYWYQQSIDNIDNKYESWRQYHLAKMFYEGKYIPRNYQKAEELFLKAAINGCEKAIYKLCIMCNEGKIQSQNKISVYILINEIATKDKKAREFRDLLENNMFIGDIFKAQSMSVEDLVK